MKFIIKATESLLGLGRKLGYKFLDERNGEYNFARVVGDHRYPRFHLYVKAQPDQLIFNLHLDQKQPSYEGQTAHSGEYEGELVEQEVERIKKFLNRKYEARSAPIDKLTK